MGTSDLSPDPSPELSSGPASDLGRGLLRCTVTACGGPLAIVEARLVCPQGHSFDRARSGYWNLLQPQDRRSRKAGDPIAVAQARRRLHERGHDDALLEGLTRVAARLGLEAKQAGAGGSTRATAGASLSGVDDAGGNVWVDVGCGEGSVLGALAARLAIHGVGIDLSAPSIELAARRFPAASPSLALTWVVANADRGLPVGTGTCRVVSSIAGRMPVAEIARVLDPERGRAIVAVAGPHDLAELRERTQGDAPAIDRAVGARELFATRFAVESTETVRTLLELDSQGLDDLLLASYRAGRRGRREKAAEAGRLSVTIERMVLVLRPRGMREARDSS